MSCPTHSRMYTKLRLHLRSICLLESTPQNHKHSIRSRIRRICNRDCADSDGDSMWSWWNWTQDDKKWYHYCLHYHGQDTIDWFVWRNIKHSDWHIQLFWDVPVNLITTKPRELSPWSKLVVTSLSRKAVSRWTYSFESPLHISAVHSKSHPKLLVPSSSISTSMWHWSKLQCYRADNLERISTDRTQMGTIYGQYPYKEFVDGPIACFGQDFNSTNMQWSTN